MEKPLVSVVNNPNFHSMKHKKLKKERKRKEIISGFEMDVLVQEYESTMSGSLFQIVVEDESAKFILSSNMIQDFNPLTQTTDVILSKFNIFQMITEIFLKSSKSLKYQFFLDFSTVGPKASKKLEKEEEYERKGEGRKRRKISKSHAFTYHDCRLFLDIITSPRFYHSSRLRFEFITIPKIEKIIGLPDEILLEFFKYLDPFYLIKKLSLVSHRIHNLIESDYMYRVHFYPSLFRIDTIPAEIIGPKPMDLTWKQHVKNCWNNQIFWQFDWPENREAFKCINDTLFDNLQDKISFQGSYRVSKGSTPEFNISDVLNLHAISFMSNRFVSARDEHEWKIRIRANNNNMDNSVLFFGVARKNYSPKWDCGTGRNSVTGHGGQGSYVACVETGVSLWNEDFEEIFSGNENFESLPNLWFFVTITLRKGVLDFFVRYDPDSVERECSDKEKEVREKIKSSSFKHEMKIAEKDMDEVFCVCFDVDQETQVDVELLSFKRL